MAIKDSIVNLKKGLRTTLTNVPALIDTLERGFTEIDKEISTSADVKKAISSFNTINGGLLSECKVKLSPIQSGSGTPSPTNVRPITGHTQVEVDVSDGQTTQEQITVNLGGTYYSGTFDVVKGVFTLTHVMWTDDGTKNWARNPDGSFYVIYTNTHPLAVQDTEGCCCNYAPFVVNFNGFVVFARANGLIMLGTGWGDIYPDVASLKAQFAIEPFQMVYKLASPQSIQLSPTMVKALVGENHLSAPLDEQEIEEVEYKEIFTYSDVEKAIDNAISSVYPEAPAVDGSYVLTLVKDGTSITRSWESTAPTNTSKKK